MPKFDREKFFDGVRHSWGALTQRRVNALNVLMDSIEADTEIEDIQWISYILATVKHETASTYEPIEEWGHGKGKPYGRLDTQTGQRYYGRGYVQITWKTNYLKFTNLLGIDLVNQPDLALEQDTAYLILSIGMRDGLFTGKKLRDYIHGDICDYLHARRIVNAMDKATQIAAYAKLFQVILEKAQVDESEPEPPKTESLSKETTSSEITTNGEKTQVLEQSSSSVFSSITGNEKIKEIAGTGLSTVGNRIAQGGISAGSGATVLAFIQGNWMILLGGLIVLILAVAMWMLIYHSKQKQKLLQTQINSDPKLLDVKYTKAIKREESKQESKQEESEEESKQ